MRTPVPDHTILFRDIIGQDKAKELLRRAVGQRRLSHAFLFKGPSGVGKKTLARIFASYINCRQPRQEEPCGECPSCRKFNSGNHPDFMLIEPEGAAIKINQVRELKKALTFPPLEADHRTVLLSEIHTMRREAANSLLKILEEPPAGTILILTGDEASGILPTILSRCQIIPFFPLPRQRLTERLIRETGLGEENAATLASVAEGSLGRARLLLKKELLPLRQRIIETILQSPPDTPATIQAIVGLAETAAKLKEDLPELIDLLKTWLHDLLLASSGARTQVSNRDLLPFFAAASQRWSRQELADRLQLLTTAQKQLNRNCNATAVCEVLFFALL
ncbi:DNA polymerase III subunit delta' [Thiovibrio sp. JS02]